MSRILLALWLILTLSSMLVEANIGDVYKIRTTKDRNLTFDYFDVLGTEAENCKISTPPLQTQRDRDDIYTLQKISAMVNLFSIALASESSPTWEPIYGLVVVADNSLRFQRADCQSYKLCIKESTSGTCSQNMFSTLPKVEDGKLVYYFPDPKNYRERGMLLPQAKDGENLIFSINGVARPIKSFLLTRDGVAISTSSLPSSPSAQGVYVVTITA